LLGDLPYDFEELARALTNVFHSNTFVVSVHALVLLDSSVERGPTVSDDAELSIELAFGIAAEHLGRDDRFRVICLCHLGDDSKQLGIDGRTIGWFERVDILNLDRGISDHSLKCR